VIAGPHQSAAPSVKLKGGRGLASRHERTRSEMPPRRANARRRVGDAGFALLLTRALSLIAAEASQSHTPAARTDKFHEIHRNSPTTILYHYMVISQLDRRVNVAPMMDWSD
jgi:hypothetical protein